MKYYVSQFWAAREQALAEQGTAVSNYICKIITLIYDIKINYKLRKEIL